MAARLMAAQQTCARPIFQADEEPPRIWSGQEGISSGRSVCGCSIASRHSYWGRHDSGTGYSHSAIHPPGSAEPSGGWSGRGFFARRMSLNRHLTVSTAALVFSWFTATSQPAFAQDPMADIRRELAALRAEVQQLRAQLDALKGAAAADSTTPGTVEILEAQVAELAQTKVESTSRVPVKVFGTVHADVFANTANANWLDNPNLVLPPPSDGHAGTTSATLRQTRLGFTVDAPRIGSLRTNAVVAMDFFGGIPAFQTGQVMALPRLLVAFARIEGERTAVEVGQDHMILAPRDPTSLAAFAFPLLFRSGNLYLRTPQARVEHLLTPRLRATAGIVAPIAGDLTGTEYVFVPPPLGGERSRRPGVQARFSYTTAEADAPRLLDLGISAHVAWERQGPNLAKSWASAVDFAARRDVIGVAGEVFVGDNVDAFGGALGLNARGAGGWSEVQWFPSARLSLATGVGLDDIRDSRRFVLPRRQNRSAYGSIVFSLTPEVQASFEYRSLRTLAGSTGRTNHHFDWVLVHTF